MQIMRNSICLDHCHVFRNGVSLSKKEVGTLSHLKSIMKQLGVKKAVTFATYPYQPPSISEEQLNQVNEWLLFALKGEKNFLPVVEMDPKANDTIEKLEEYVKKGAVGIKIHPIDTKSTFNDPSLEDFYQLAEELGLPITFHTGVHGWYLKNYRPLLLDEIAQNHPKLPIILAHVGGMVFFNEALAVLQNNPNTYAGLVYNRKKGSLYLFPEQIKMLLMTIGPERIIYGTDFPCSSLEDINEDIEDIKNWPITKEAKDLILGENLKKLYKKALLQF